MDRIYKTTGYVLKESLEKKDYEQYDKGDKPLHISSRGRPYRVSGDPFLSEIRQHVFHPILQNGLLVAGQVYTLSPVAAEKLGTEPYLDILPDDLMDAIYLNSMPTGGRLANPHTGTAVVLGTDHAILDVALPGSQATGQDAPLLFDQPQVKHAVGEPTRIVKYGGYVVQAGMGSAYAGEDKLNNREYEHIHRYLTDQNTVTSNLGNSYDISPFSNHRMTTESKIKGSANSSVDILNSQGQISTRRWFDENGDRCREIHFTDHGNSTRHPEVPHEHLF